MLDGLDEMSTRVPLLRLSGHMRGCQWQPRAKYRIYKKGEKGGEAANLKKLTASLGQPAISQTDGLHMNLEWK